MVQLETTGTKSWGCRALRTRADQAWVGVMMGWEPGGLSGTVRARLIVTMAASLRWRGFGCSVSVGRGGEYIGESCVS